MREPLFKQVCLVAASLVVPFCIAALVESADPASAEDGESAFAEAQRRYASLHSLHQRCTWTSAPVPGEEAPPYAVGEGLAQSSDLFFERPNRVRITDDVLELVSNGTTLWIADRARNEVVIRPAPEKLENTAQLPESEVSTFRDFPIRLVMGLLFPDSNTQRTDPTSLDGLVLSGVAAEARNGIPGRLISFHKPGLQGPVSTAWISSETGLIEQWSLVYRLKWHGNREDPNDDVVYHQGTDVECSLVTPNPEFADGLFELNPATNLHEVDRLSMFRWRDRSHRMPFNERIAPTVSLADSSTEPLNPHQVNSEETFSNSMIGPHQPGDRIDINRDGIDDLVLPMSHGEALLVDGASAAVEILTLHGRAADGIISTVIPVWMDDTRLWLVESNHHERGAGFSRVVFSLHGPDGAERWAFSPELAEGLSSRGTCAVGDLDGDGTPEVVVGIQMHSRIPLEGDAFRIESGGSIITILDLDGHRPSQILLDGGIVDLEIGGPGADTFVICVLGDRVVKLLFKPDAKERRPADSETPSQFQAGARRKILL